MRVCVLVLSVLLLLCSCGISAAEQWNSLSALGVTTSLISVLVVCGTTCVGHSSPDSLVAVSSPDILLDLDQLSVGRDPRDLVEEEEGSGEQQEGQQLDGQVEAEISAELTAFSTTTIIHTDTNTQQQQQPGLSAKISAVSRAYLSLSLLAAISIFSLVIAF